MNLDQIESLYAVIGKPYGGVYRGLPGQYDFGTYRQYSMFKEVLKDETPISAEWDSYYGRFGPPPALNDEITYERCQEWSYDPVKRQLTIKCWQGDSCDGHPEKVRATWIYEIRDEHTSIVELIEKKLMVMVGNQAHHDELEAEKRKYEARVLARVNKFLSEAKVTS
jgi:hypothetical protein